MTELRPQSSKAQSSKPLPPALRIFFGLLCLASGILPALAAFDVGPLDSGDINGPPWLGLVAGGIFILAGIALIFGDSGQRAPGGLLSYLFTAVMFGAFAAIANWIAFGPGPRECSVAVVGLMLNGFANALSCRIGFGIGAVMLNGCLVWIAGAALEKLAGPSRLTRAINVLGLVVLGLALAPIALPLLLYMLGRGLISGYATYRRTGAWPRNEAFIARMKARRKGAP